jgi:hypothetical protein
VATAGTTQLDAPEQADVDIAVATDLHLVLSGRLLTAAEQHVLRGVASQALLALRAQRLAAEADDAKRRAEATELRSALLSAVGHDLRTPLTAITASETPNCSFPPTTPPPNWPPSKNAPTDCKHWSRTCSTRPGSPPAASSHNFVPWATTRSSDRPWPAWTPGI